MRPGEQPRERPVRVREEVGTRVDVWIAEEGGVNPAAPVFYLGTDAVAWLWNEVVDCRLFVSHGRLRPRKSPFPSSVVPGWALDSRGFTELRQNGQWTISPREYVEATARYISEIGRMEFAAPQDWMCERPIIEGGTWDGQRFAGTRSFLDPGNALTYEQLVAEHQRRTVANYAELGALWHEYRLAGECRGDSPYRPVLQGEPGNVESYLRCAQMYEDAGIRLADQELVGVGSVCRVQSEPAIGHLARGISRLGLRTHWFGLKLTGLPYVWPNITSHDSMSWSVQARREPRMKGCTHVAVRGKHAGRPSPCAHCPTYARWYQRRVVTLGKSLSQGGCQLDLFDDLGDAA